MTLMKVDGSRFAPIDVNADILPCPCGGKIEFSLAYGRTPYCFFCPACTNNFQNDVTNCTPEAAIGYLNQFLSGGQQQFKFTIWNYNSYIQPDKKERGDG